MDAIGQFQERIDCFLQKLLDKPIDKDYSSKIIHDALWGTTKFFSWEIALIDTPLMQRLRRIHQIGLAYLIFPSATHTRFDHSLGVTILVDKIITHLNLNAESNIIKIKERIRLRLAALLHDTGHSFLSHVSEQVYEHNPDFQRLREEIFNKYEVRPKGHEIMTFLIIKSPFFQSYFKSMIENLRHRKDNAQIRQLSDINLDEIACYIIGYTEDPTKKYLADIINGPIDCDKIDYLNRDAKYTGTEIFFDLNRFLFSLTTLKIGPKVRLTVTLNGLSTLEQLVLSKIYMFSQVYYHQKLRAAEAMLKRLCIYIIKEQETKQSVVSLSHPVDFLKYTDEIILTNNFELFNYSSNVNKYLKALIYRQLWIRAQIVSTLNIEEDFISDKILRLEVDLSKKPSASELVRLKTDILSKVKLMDPDSNIRIEDFWVDMPSIPSYSEIIGLSIKMGFNDESSILFPNFYKFSDWLDSVIHAKIKMHIFCDSEYQAVIYNASSHVLKEKYNVTIKPFTKNLIKLKT
jgi:uncharacterized protein